MDLMTFKSVLIMTFLYRVTLRTMACYAGGTERGVVVVLASMIWRLLNKVKVVLICEFSRFNFIHIKVHLHIN